MWTWKLLNHTFDGYKRTQKPFRQTLCLTVTVVHFSVVICLPNDPNCTVRTNAPHFIPRPCGRRKSAPSSFMWSGYKASMYEHRMKLFLTTSCVLGWTHLCRQWWWQTNTHKTPRQMNTQDTQTNEHTDAPINELLCPGLWGETADVYLPNYKMALYTKTME